MNDTPPTRCRLVLAAPAGADRASLAARIADAGAGGDVASLILPQYGLDDAAFQALAEAVVAPAQAQGVAVMIAGEPRIAARTGADGIHVEGGRAALADLIDRYQPKMMVGAGGAKDRDAALELGELRPDYLFFGRFGYDTKSEPHARNLALGRWWSEMVEIPCLVLGGATVESVADVAATGAEFVVLSTAVFGEGVDATAAVAQANRILDETAPAFETAS